MSPFTESVVEEAALKWFGALGGESSLARPSRPGEPVARMSGLRKTFTVHHPTR
jgi:hypothetical protein